MNYSKMDEYFTIKYLILSNNGLYSKLKNKYGTFSHFREWSIETLFLMNRQYLKQQGDQK